MLAEWANKSHWPLLSPERTNNTVKIITQRVKEAKLQQKIYMATVFRVEYMHNKYHNTWG
jgi:nicotinamide mononucleotide adenylyltransferase